MKKSLTAFKTLIFWFSSRIIKDLKVITRSNRLPSFSIWINFINWLIHPQIITEKRFSVLHQFNLTWLKAWPSLRSIINYHKLPYIPILIFSVKYWNHWCNWIIIFRYIEAYSFWWVVAPWVIVNLWLVNFQMPFHHI